MAVKMIVRKCRLVAAALLQSSTHLRSLDRIHWKKNSTDNFKRRWRNPSCNLQTQQGWWKKKV